MIFALLFLGTMMCFSTCSSYSLANATAPAGFFQGTIENTKSTSISLEDRVLSKTAVFVPAPDSQDGVYYYFRVGADVEAAFGESRVLYVVDNTAFLMEFPSSLPVIPEGFDPARSTTNYFFGSDPALWDANIQDCKGLQYKNLYQGIDLIYRLKDGQLKYEFHVAPGADPGQIRMQYANVDSITIDATATTLEIRQQSAVLRDGGLCAYQEIQSASSPVGCTFQAAGTTAVGFKVENRDLSLPLVIDPFVFYYSTVFGGSGNDLGTAVAVENGYIYVLGSTENSTVKFPTTAGAYDIVHNGLRDVFVAKISPDGHSLIYSTFLGGQGDDTGMDIAVENGIAYICGTTNDAAVDFPTTGGAYDTGHNGLTDVFVTKIASAGNSLIFSTFIGGSDNDYADGIAIGAGSTVFVTGATEDAGVDFPTTGGAYDQIQNGARDGFVTKFASTGASLLYSTFLGGVSDDQCNALAVDGDGCAYVTGTTWGNDFPITAGVVDGTKGGISEAFVTKINPTGATLNYSTYLGGSQGDYGYGICVENKHAYVVGDTYSTNFPVTETAYDPFFNANQDVFVAELSLNASSFVYSTYIGGGGDDYGTDIVVNNSYAYITGSAWTGGSGRFPTTPDAFDRTQNANEVFMTKIAPGGTSLVYSTFFGSTGHDTGYGIEVKDDIVYVVGYTDGSFTDFPVTPDALYQAQYGAQEGFLFMFAPDGDADGLIDRDEYALGTDPSDIDSDHDNFLDGYEVQVGTDPTDPLDYPSIYQADFDLLLGYLNGNATLIQTLYTMLDGNATLLSIYMGFQVGNWSYLQAMQSTLLANISAIETVLYAIDGVLGDVDSDGLADIYEIGNGTNPTCIDTDCDNLNDAFELKYGTNPLDDDTDDDGYYDGIEVASGTDPLDVNDYPGSGGGDGGMTMIIIIGVIAAVVAVISGVVIKTRRSKEKKSNRD